MNKNRPNRDFPWTRGPSVLQTTGTIHHATNPNSTTNNSNEGEPNMTIEINSNGIITNGTTNNDTTKGDSTMNITSTELANLRHEGACNVIDNNRFADHVEAVLARIGDDAVTLFPDAETLENMGFDVVTIGTLLSHDCITPAEIANIVGDVDQGALVVGFANRQLMDRCPLVNDETGETITMADANDMGIDLDALTACRGHSLTDAVLFDLLANVQKGELAADDANTGLGHYADGDVRTTPRHLEIA